MTSLPSPTTIATPSPQRRAWRQRVAEPPIWASLAITSMWLAVVAIGIWGPDFVSTSPGGNYTRLPSVIVVVVFAYLGTRVVARYGFGRPSREDAPPADRS